MSSGSPHHNKKQEQASPCDLSQQIAGPFRETLPHVQGVAVKQEKERT